MLSRRQFLSSSAATALTLSSFRSTRAFSQGNLVNVSSDVALFGCDYYPDQTPEALWQEDAADMAKMGITNVRIAEFAWSLMEPSEGSFHFEWLHRAVEILHAHGIAVILGTPSAAPPPWLSMKYPDIVMVNDKGLPLSPGTRRFTCPTNPTYRRLSNAIATQMAQTFASTAGVVGWQIDNELTLGETSRCYCHFCCTGFQQWLRDKYKSLDAINQAWGTVVWSNVYTSYDQIPVPLPSGAAANPGFVLDYDRYQSAANVSFLSEQLSILRKLCPRHFVTTNNVGGLIDSIELRDLYRQLDFASADNYPGFFTLFFSGSGGPAMSSTSMVPVISFTHDFYRGLKDGKPFMIMEQQAGKAGQTVFSEEPEPGQLRLWSYQAVAHGAMGINYFRWDTPTFGAEQYWHGLLRHDRSPSPGFAEVQRTIGELKSLGAEALNAPCPSSLALCFDYDSDWALTLQPGSQKLKYISEILSWYGCLSASHANIDIVSATKDLSAYKVLCGPAMYVLSQQQAERIRSFVQNGGTFIAGVRLGVKQESSRIVDSPLPGALRDVMGVELLDYQSLYIQKQSVQFSGLLAGTAAECTVWSDILTPLPSDHPAEVLATYTVGRYAGKAAVTSHTYGKGRAIYLGTHLETADLARVLLTLVGHAGVQPAMQVPQNVEVTTRRSATKSWTYLLNHNATPQTVALPGRFQEMLTHTSVSGNITLEPYGVRVLQAT